MNKKGQAYSTFQLLIAAVIAMALLAILIPIIMKVMGIITADPENETKQLISAAIDAPSSIKKTPDVAFQPGRGLSAQAITEKTGISEDQICMSIGDYSENEFKLSSTEDRIIFNGSSPKTVRVIVICNVDEIELEEDFAAYEDVLPDNRPDCSDACDKDFCCAVMLSRR